jgi:hypothetical protein
MSLRLLAGNGEFCLWEFAMRLYYLGLCPAPDNSFIESRLVIEDFHRYSRIILD